MKVQVQLFASMKEFLPGNGDYSSCQVTLEEGARVKHLLERLAIPVDLPKIVLINGLTVKPDKELKEGDTIHIFPPITGGCPFN